MIAVITVMPAAGGDATYRRACQAADQRARRRIPTMIVVVGPTSVAIGWVAVAPITVGRIAVTIGRVPTIIWIAVGMGRIPIIAMGRVGVDIDRIGDLVVRV